MPFTKTNGIDTYYELHGQGPPLVLIHGLGSSAADWEYQVEYFAQRYQVLVYDIRGHGQTEKAPGPYDVPLFTADLVALMDALDIPQAHIVGISMGGWVAFQLAASHLPRITSLTIINSWADMIPRTKEERRGVFQRTVLFRLLSMRKIGETLSKRLFIKPEQEEIRQTFVERWAKNHKPSYMAAFRGGLGWSVVDRLPEITCPVLVLASDEDYSSVESKQAYVDILPDARLVVVEDARHALTVEKPDEVNQALDEFLSSLG